MKLKLGLIAAAYLWGVPGFMADMMLGNLRSLMAMMPEGMLAGLTGAGPEAKDAVTTDGERTRWFGPSQSNVVSDVLQGWLLATGRVDVP